MRLDNYLVHKGFFESRNRAQNAIKESLVLVNKKILKKPSYRVLDSDSIEILESKFYISRAAKKLEEYLKEFNLPISSAKCLDVGSSTGGFTQILLENGAKEVYAVDVGKEQLHHSLRKDSRVKIYEECDIRDFKISGFDIVVSDVSFISLNYIIDSINSIAKKRAYITLLFKPQFEVGSNIKRDSKGVVLDNRAIENAKKSFLDNTKKLNWKLIDSRISKLKGKEGNIEYFYTFIKG